MSDLSPEERQRIYEEEKARKEAQARIQAEQTKKGCLGCLGIVAIIAVIFGVIGYFSMPSEEERAASQAAESEKRCADSTEAFIVSEQFVRRLLKAPATAKFPSSADVTKKYIGNCTHEILAYVDAQNSFGANIRTRYYAKLQNKKGTENWTALDVHLIE